MSFFSNMDISAERKRLEGAPTSSASRQARTTEILARQSRIRDGDSQANNRQGYEAISGLSHIVTHTVKGNNGLTEAVAKLVAEIYALQTEGAVLAKFLHSDYKSVLKDTSEISNITPNIVIEAVDAIRQLKKLLDEATINFVESSKAQITAKGAVKEMVRQFSGQLSFPEAVVAASDPTVRDRVQEKYMLYDEQLLRHQEEDDRKYALQLQEEENMQA
ncbi:ORF4 protein [Lentinula edodes negative-strand RNA virus 1]|uniref:ORF4 protein n=1 Tax=Lentinula edodes negative-strand RNA virus 1 TaxID=2547430 RepID=A0A4P2VPA5_9MONO|nr:ORF4 protein [Lentinula edodes negative-strand RNA virus 1]BBI93114.1 ORF4 protein [Lentinula edodes negative-strand RNA virus 1]